MKLEPMHHLIERARIGDPAAMEELLAKVAPSVHRFGLRMCKNEHDADDVLQDTLLSIATHLRDFEGRSSLLSWVFTLTRTACARRRRGLKNQPMVSDADLPETHDSTPTPEQRTADRELVEALGRAVNGLPEEYWEAIVLRDIEGLAMADAADALGITIEALKGRLRRAREALRAILRPLLEPVEVKPSPGCPDVMALWNKKLDGDLSSRDCAAMEEHLKVCAACGTACDALRQALLACASLATNELSAEVRASVRAALRAWTDKYRAAT
jgi:RNA polymerase sigma-70 factor (ECF subfamily)